MFNCVPEVVPTKLKIVSPLPTWIACARLPVTTVGDRSKLSCMLAPFCAT